MTGGGDNRFLVVLGGGLVVAYAALAHYTSQMIDAAHWAVLLAILPPAAIGFGMLRATVPGPLPWLAAAAAATLAATVWPTLQHHVGAVYFAQHVGINSALGLFFGRTLFGGRAPLCTQFATLAHGHVSPRLARYTRRVTIAWTLFFLCTVATSVLLFAGVSLEAWSLFANLLTMPLVGAMFVAEGIVRRFALPPEERLGILATIAVYRKAMAMRSSRTPSAS